MHKLYNSLLGIVSITIWMKQAIGSLAPRTSHHEKRKYTTWTIYIPTSISQDDRFPFSLEKQTLKITIEGDKLIVEAGELK